MATEQRLLPSVVDEIAEVNPHRILYSVPKTNNILDGFHDITSRAFAQAVNRCAWHIQANVGRGGPNFPTLAYIGPQDIVYAILVLACIKTGYKLLLTSPRNTLEAHLSLLEKTECDIFLLPLSFPLPIVKRILAARKMNVLEIPGWQYWTKEGLEDQEVKLYPYDKTYSDARLEPFVVLHTSGSTGLPKPVVQTHATVAPLEAFTALTSSGKPSTYPAMCAGQRVYLAFPLFHCAGMSMLLPASIYAGFTIVLGTFPPSAEIVNNIHMHGNVQQSCLTPMTLIDLVKNPEYLENLRNLKQITFGGGPCPKAVGDLVTSKTRLLNCLGTTECSVLPAQLCDPEDWAYMSVNPVLGHEFQHISEDLYEKVIVKNAELEAYQAVFGTFPDLDEYRMGDLYSRHPSKQNVWLYRGRADDIIVFSNGEKLNPLEMEEIICAHPSVRAAIITGLGRVQSSLLIEAGASPIDAGEKKDLIDNVWPSIQAANKKSPSYGRIHRHMILFTSPEIPMLRAGKGTVQRRLTIDLYARELDALYDASDVKLERRLKGVTAKVSSSVKNLVRQAITTCMEIDVAGLDISVDLFELGLDSLQILHMTRKINKGLSSLGKSSSIDPRVIYANPSIGALTNAVIALSDGRSLFFNGTRGVEKLQRIFDTYVENLPITARKPQERKCSNFVVLLAGSTGSLGPYILDSLISDSRVSRVYCLNRGPSSYHRQQKSHTEKGLHIPQDKVQFLDVDLSKSYFGLSIPKYKDLLNSVTTVIHNAWLVDFNKSIDSFAVHVRTVRDLIGFSSRSRFGATLFFVSSISAVRNWRTVTYNAGQENVPECVLQDWRLPEQKGYGQSKFIAERLLDIAARKASIPTTICRVGQVAGPTTAAGLWPKHEWLPSLIASSKYLSRLPADLGVMEMVDWIPVEVLGRGLVELALGSSNARNKDPYPGAEVYHALNPQRTTWAALVRTVARYLGIEKEIPVVPLTEWVGELRESAKRTEDAVQNPAIKLLDFYESLLKKGEKPIVFETKKACDMSQTIASLTAVQEEWVANWMKQWSF